MEAAEKKQRLEQFGAALRAAGLPLTIQRRVVFEAMLQREDHPTAEQVYQAVRQELPQISRMTVHRILNTLVALGVVEKTCHPGSAARFDANTHPHHHLVCLECGAILDVEDPRLDRVPWPRIHPRKFVIEDCQVQFRGRCAACRRKARGPGRRSPARRAFPGAVPSGFQTLTHITRKETQP